MDTLRTLRTRVKICGITRERDAEVAVRAGADAVGLVFWPRSSRYVLPERAAAIRARVPPLVSVVAVFVDPDETTVRDVLERVAPDVLQFHGDEPAEACERWGRPYLKAVRVGRGAPPEVVAQRHPRAAALLLDTYRPGRPGGTGATFDWSAVPADPGKPVVLAGGLDPGNVAGAIAALHPFAVDVSGGVESAPGVKDPSRVRAFIEEVIGANQTQRAR